MIAWAPFALMFVCGISIRAAIALPMTHQANWLHRRRLAMWRETPLIFDDDLPDQPLQLGL